MLNGQAASGAPAQQAAGAEHQQQNPGSEQQGTQAAGAEHQQQQATATEWKPPTQEEWESMQAKAADLQRSRDQTKERLRAQEEEHRARLAETIAQAQQAGDLAKAMESQTQLIESLKSKAERTERLEEAFKARVEAARKELPADILSSIPENIPPLAELNVLDAMRRIAAVKQAAGQTTTTPPFSPPLPPKTPGAPSGFEQKLDAFVKATEQEQMRMLSDETFTVDEIGKLRAAIR